MTISHIRELLDFNHWANLRLLEVAETIDDTGLDWPFEMGMGTLRQTIRHIFWAEGIWYGRVCGAQAAPLPALSDKPTVAEMRGVFDAIVAARDAWLATATDADLPRVIQYKTMKGEPFANAIVDILVHVCNHGMHHRAQASNMCRHIGKTYANSDYLRMRLARPTMRVPSDAVAEALRAAGLTIGNSLEAPRGFSVALMREQFRYDEWANEELLRAAAAIDEARLDRPFEMGLGTLRKTLLHIEAAEHYWLTIWCGDASPAWRVLDETTNVAGLRDAFASIRDRRNGLLSTLDDPALQGEVSAEPRPGMRLYFRLGETMLQIFFHGTYHRAQALNMLRHVAAPLPAMDYVRWMRDVRQNS